MTRLLLPYPIAANRLWRVVDGRIVLSAAAKAWKQEVALRLLVAGVRRPLAGPVGVEMTLHPRTTQSGRASDTRLDVDAPIKLTLDALQGLAYANDKQVTQVTSRIGTPLPDGGLSVSISPLQETPCPTTPL
jgi:crossover junction endodeoxyribonuclease RusA